GCPIRSIHVSEGLSPGGLVFDPDADEGPLGQMFENRVLRNALRETALVASRVTLVMPGRPAATVRGPFGVEVTLEDGRAFTAPLLIGAEGRASPTRDA